MKTSTVPIFLCLFLSVAPGAPQYEQGTLLQGIQYDSCHYDCFPLDRPTLYFCVQVDDRILVASKGADPVWAYDSSRIFALVGQPISARFDDRWLWIVRPDGNEIRLKQDYSRDVFAGSECSREVRRHWLNRLVHAARPPTVSPDAVLVPLSPRSHVWIRCTYDARNYWDVCAIWDNKGWRYPNDRELVNAATRAAVLDPNPLIDPIAMTNDFEIHLTDGVVLKDWAKSRVNDLPSADSVRPNPPKPPTPERPH